MLYNMAVDNPSDCVAKPLAALLMVMLSQTFVKKSFRDFPTLHKQFFECFSNMVSRIDIQKRNREFSEMQI